MIVNEQLFNNLIRDILLGIKLILGLVFGFLFFGVFYCQSILPWEQHLFSYFFVVVIPFCMMVQVTHKSQCIEWFSNPSCMNLVKFNIVYDVRM